MAVGGQDPTGGAGLFADIRALCAAGVRIAACVTAVTAQNSRGVSSFQAVTPEMLLAQMRSVAEDHTIHALKIGMIGHVDLVDALNEFLRTHPIPYVVLDPVIQASAGGVFADQALIDRILSGLLPRLTLITPNLPELTMITHFQVNDPTRVRTAAEYLIGRGCKAVLVKGGHSEGTPVDRLYQIGEEHAYRASRLVGRIRGTGCGLASFISGRLAQGDTLIDAIKKARYYIRRQFRDYGRCGRTLLGAWIPEEHRESTGTARS